MAPMMVALPRHPELREMDLPCVAQRSDDWTLPMIRYEARRALRTVRRVNLSILYATPQFLSRVSAGHVSHMGRAADTLVGARFLAR